MGSNTQMLEQSRVSRFVRPIAVFGVAIPLVVLAGLYVVAGVVDVVFGTVLFGVTVVAAGAWTLVGISGRLLDAARPSGELHRGSASEYGRELSGGTFTRLSTPFRALLVLTGTVLLGWFGVIVR